MKGVNRYAVVCLASLATLMQAPAATAGDDGVLAIVAASALIASQMNESADEDSDAFVFIPSIGYQHKRLKFEQEYTAGFNQGRTAEFDATIPTINTSLTVARNRFFATLKYETELADTSVTTQENTQGFVAYQLNIPGGSTDVEREDMSITLGYNIWTSLNFFVGYMKGKTELTPDPGCGFSPPDSGCLDAGFNPTPTALLNLAIDHQYGGLSDYQQTYEEEGPYIGLSYAWQVADAGSLSFSAAYAKMDGEYRDNYAAVANQNFKYTGDSTGTSFGLTWTAPLGESSNYFIDIREQKYDMDADDNNGNFPGAAVKTEETMKGFTAGVQVYF